MITSDVVIRILLELSIVFVGGLVAFLIGWLIRHDREIAKLREDNAKFKEEADHLRFIADRNIPDAWKESDKAKDTLIASLTKLCTDVCAKNSK